MVGSRKKDHPSVLPINMSAPQADPALATRAPESDLYEESLSDDKNTSSTSSNKPSPDPQAPIQPQMSPHCTSDRPLPATLSDPPSGELTKWHLTHPHAPKEVEVYISRPSDYPSTPAKLLLLLTNGTGINSPNNKHQADFFARHNYLVIMPDLFNKDPAPNSKPAEDIPGDSADSSWIDTLKLKAAETAKSFMLDMWLARHTEETVMPVVRGILEKATEEFGDAAEYGEGVYAVGYCFGGRYVLLLAGQEKDRGLEKEAKEEHVIKGPEIRCGVVAHGTLIGREDIKGVKSPVQLICVRNDPLFPEEVLENGRKYLEEGKVEHEIEVYEGCPHGFAVVGEYESQTIKEAQSKAFEGMVRWLDAH